MRCLVSAGAFRKRLAAVAALIPRRISKPVLGTVRLEIDERGRGTLVATDLVTWVRLETPALRGTRPGAAQLPPRALADALDGRGGEEIELDADPDRFALACSAADLPCRLFVSGPRSRATLPTYSPEDFPAHTQAASEGRYRIARKDFVRLIRTTAFAADPECTRYQLGGPCLELGEGAIDVVATDGYRLAHAWTRAVAVIGSPAAPAERTPPDGARALAPVVGARALVVLARLLDELKSPLEPVDVGWTPDGHLRVGSTGLAFSTRQLEGRFPAWRGALPPPSPRRGHLVRSDRLLEILKRARTLADRERPRARLGLEPGKLTVTVDSGAGVERFETFSDCRGEPAEAALNPEQLIDVLEVLKGEAVDLELNGPGIPAVLYAPGLRYCVMPLDSEKPAAQPAARLGETPGEGVVDDPEREARADPLDEAV
jgi:DNA polymerase-3 subunit beta